LPRNRITKRGEIEKTYVVTVPDKQKGGGPGQQKGEEKKTAVDKLKTTRELERDGGSSQEGFNCAGRFKIDQMERGQRNLTAGWISLTERKELRWFCKNA